MAEAFVHTYGEKVGDIAVTQLFLLIMKVYLNI